MKIVIAGEDFLYQTYGMFPGSDIRKQNKSLLLALTFSRPNLAVSPDSEIYGLF